METASPHPTARTSRLGMFALAALAVVLAVAVLVGHAGRTSASVAAKVDARTLQAVSLTTGQIFIGRLHDDGGDYIVLQDAHYVRRVPKTATRPAHAEVVPTSRRVDSPTSRIVIARSQVVTVEDVSKGSAAARAAGL